MIVLPIVKGYTVNPGRWKACARFVDTILALFGVYYIVALCVDYGGKYYVCSGTRTEVNNSWELSLASTIGRNLATLLLLADCCLKIGKSSLRSAFEAVGYFVFILETLPGLLLFHILLTSNQPCLEEFFDDYIFLGKAIMMQAYISFTLVIVAGLWFLYTLLLILLGDREVWSENAKSAAILEDDESHKEDHGYVIKDKQVFI